MTRFVASLPTVEIRDAAKRDVSSVLAYLLRRSDATDLHGFAICTIFDATGVYYIAETEGQLALGYYGRPAPRQTVPRADWIAFVTNVLSR
jgi:hypothetical protein